MKIKENHINLDTNKTGSAGFPENNGIDVKQVTSGNYFESKNSKSGRIFLFYITEDKGETFLLKNTTSDIYSSKEIKSGFFESKEAFFAFNEKIKAHLSNIFKEQKSEYLVFEIISQNSGIKTIEINIDKVSDQEIVLFINDVSGLSNTIASFEANRKSLNELQDTVPIGLFQVDIDGIIKYANNWFVKILGGSSKKELIGNNLKKYFDKPKEADDYFASLNEKEHVSEKQVLLSNKNNGKTWVTLKAERANDNNNMAFFDGIMYDITERKQVLEQLKESEEMFRAMSHNMKGALYIFNQKGDFSYCNPAAAEISGYPNDELLEMKFYDIVHPDYMEIARERGLNRIAGNEESPLYETKILTKDGDEKWLEVSATRLMLAGEPVVMGLANDITERKEAIEAIRSNKDKYKSLYSFIRLMADNVPDLIWAKNLDGEYIFTNKALCKKLLLAKDTDEPVGKSDLYFAERERKNKPDYPNWYTFGEISTESDNLVIKSELPHHVDEYGFVKGQFMYLDVYKSPLYDDSGNLIGLVGSARDVTAQKRLEDEKLREESLKHVVYRIGNAVNTTKDLSELFTVIRLEISEVIDTTNMYIALYNKENDSLSLPYFIDEKDRFGAIPDSNSLTHYLIRTKKSLLLKEKDYEKLAEENDFELIGTQAKVWLGVPLQVNNETIGALVVQDYHDEHAYTLKDLELLNFVSLQISTSISQKKADDALRENEFALRQIIDNVPVMIFAKDKLKRIVLANKEFAKVYGKRVNKIEGKSQSELHPYEDELLKYNADDDIVLKEGKSVINSDEVFTDFNGERRILQTVKIPIKTDTEKGIAILGVAIDITERNKAEEELKRAKDKAEESDRLKTAFLANMSHEIRTPMNAIIGFSELLNDPDLTKDSRREFTNLIGDNSKILLKLIEDIIDVAKIEAKQVKVIKSTCQVNQILNELYAKYKDHAKKLPNKKIDIKLNLSILDVKFSIESDPFRFKQIVNNLLDNAIKFTESGSVELGYKIQKKDTILFFVKDTGIGLAPEKLSFIFERFRQAEESSTKEYRGTGLGLTIASRLVEMLGGKLWVESELGKGSVFYFSLPYISKKVTENLKHFTNQKVKKDWKGKTILVAEDETSNFELINATLRQTNINIIRAKNGLEAIALFRKHKNIDIILMDIRMPEMNGYEATKIIKSEKKDLPIIALTAYAMAEDQGRSVQAGCDEYISKPYNPSDLISKVGNFIK